MGDVTITLPYVAALRRMMPDARLDFLTNKASADIPGQISDIDSVYAIGGGRNRHLQFIAAATHSGWILRGCVSSGPVFQHETLD